MNTRGTSFSYPDDGVENRIKTNYAKQGFMHHIGAELADISPGIVELSLPYSRNVDQQHGFFHGGALATLADVAAGTAAQTLIGEGASVLTTEFKINFVAPAIGDLVIARGRVIKFGRTLTVCQSDVYSQNGETETLVATALLTMIGVPASRNREKQDAVK